MQRLVEVILTFFEIGKEPLGIVRRMAEAGITLVCIFTKQKLTTVGLTNVVSTSSPVSQL